MGCILNTSELEARIIEANIFDSVDEDPWHEWNKNLLKEWKPIMDRNYPRPNGKRDLDVYGDFTAVLGTIQIKSVQVHTYRNS